jgi:hypothetical protein
MGFVLQQRGYASWTHCIGLEDFLKNFGNSCACAFADRGIQPEQISEAFHAFQHNQSPAFLSPLAAAAVSNQTIQESMRLLLLIRAYQVCAASILNM